MRQLLLCMQMNFRTEIVQGEMQLSLLFSYMKHLYKVFESCHKLGIPVNLDENVTPSSYISSTAESAGDLL